MRERLDKLPRELKDQIARASCVADRLNIPAYLVGGFVRDLMLGEKNLDLDIVVDGDGINFADALADDLGAEIIRHNRFGTATVLISPDLKIDIATARRESYPKPASLPVVQKGTLQEDLARRDFSINSIAISINKAGFGELIDFFAGSSDILRRKIRVLHDRSFIDDPTRILRAVRFEQRYGFHIEPVTLGYMERARKSRMLEKVQPQRLREELILLLKEKCPGKNMKRLQRLVGLDFMRSGFSPGHKEYALLAEAFRQASWFEDRFPAYRKIDKWLIYLIALMDGLSPASVNAICEKFAFRKGERKRISSYKEIGTSEIKDLSSSGISPDRIYSLLEPLSYEVIILLRARQRNGLFRRHIAEFLKIYNGMRLCISGEDLNGLGIRPGPHYRQLFSAVLNAKLNGLVKTPQEELGMIRRLIHKK